MTSTALGSSSTTRIVRVRCAARQRQVAVDVPSDDDDGHAGQLSVLADQRQELPAVHARQVHIKRNQAEVVLGSHLQRRLTAACAYDRKTLGLEQQTHQV